jgi:hypothetical protein
MMGCEKENTDIKIEYIETTMSFNKPVFTWLDGSQSKECIDTMFLFGSNLGMRNENVRKEWSLEMLSLKLLSSVIQTIQTVEEKGAASWKSDYADPFLRSKEEQKLCNEFLGIIRKMVKL